MSSHPCWVWAAEAWARVCLPQKWCQREALAGPSADLNRCWQAGAWLPRSLQAGHQPQSFSSGLIVSKVGNSMMFGGQEAGHALQKIDFNEMSEPSSGGAREVHPHSAELLSHSRSPALCFLDRLQARVMPAEVFPFSSLPGFGRQDGDTTILP